MKIITWNVNGIRSRIFNENISSKLKKNQKIIVEQDSSMEKLLKYDPDFICLQETRCSLANSYNVSIAGYKSFFNESKMTDARGPDRYSGTAIFYKDTIKEIEFNTNVPGYDDLEGRIIIAETPCIIIVTVYAPNSGTNYEAKREFNAVFLEYLSNISKPIVFCGDLNLAKQTHFDQSKVPPGPGTYPHELKFYDDLILNGYQDAISDDDNIIYTWWDPRQRKENGMSICRNRNKGWRLDYFLTKNINQASSICLKNIGENNQGIPLSSDHAPVYLITKI
jgi:exodeoxyribonuclease III